MPNLTFFIGPVLALTLLTVVVVQLLRRRLRERHALWWAVGSIVALLLSLFPGWLESISHAIGFSVPLNLVLIIALALVFLVSLQHSAELTELEAKVRTLAEHVAELEMTEHPLAPGAATPMAAPPADSIEPRPANSQDQPHD